MPRALPRSERRYIVDPKDPRAPPEDVWARMTPAERRRAVESLPSEFPVSEANPPEGDPHFNAKVGARDMLRGFFARTGRRVYLACELPVYYPGEAIFAPDVLAVVDVETREREKWVVSEEARGLDFVLEVMYSSHKKKDLETNVAQYARLGIPEYFVFDRRRLRLFGFRLPAPAVEESRASSGRPCVYQPIMPQGGRYSSQVLGLDCSPGPGMAELSGRRSAEAPASGDPSRAPDVPFLEVARAHVRARLHELTAQRKGDDAPYVHRLLLKETPELREQHDPVDALLAWRFDREWGRRAGVLPDEELHRALVQMRRLPAPDDVER